MLPAAYESAPVLYVSPGRIGDDKNTGTTTQLPLKTIAAAVAKIDREGTIQLLDGLYPDQKLKLAGKQLTIKAATDSHPRLTSLTIEVTDSTIGLRSLEVRGETDFKADGKSAWSLRDCIFGGSSRFEGGKSAALEDSRWSRAAAVIREIGGKSGTGRLKNSSALRIERCWSVDSPAAGISVLDCAGGASIGNCLVARASREGLSIERTSAKIDFSTLADNGGFALSALRSSVKIRNSIVASGSRRLRQGTAIDSQFNLYSSGEPAEYGVNDLIGEPKFGLALAGGDLEKYRPLSASPARGAADPAASGGMDLTRYLWNARHDLGCIQVSRTR